MVEMVCDWTAMSQEYGEKSCRKWVTENIDKKFKFSEERKKEIWEVIEYLDKVNGV